MVAIVKLELLDPRERKVRGLATGKRAKANASTKMLVISYRRSRNGKLTGGTEIVANAAAVENVQVAPAKSAPLEMPLARFKAAFGSLKDRHAFGEDATEFQREMREEWR